MKKLLRKPLFYVVGFVVLILLSLFIYLTFDAYYVGIYFRTMQDPISATENVDLRGLREMNLSGGRAPRFPDLQRRLSHIKLNKIIVDVKCEPHGYINGIPTSFLGYNVNRPGSRHYLRRLFWTRTMEEKPEAMISEEEEAKKYGFSYRTVNIGSKFTAVDEYIDDIVNFIDNVPKDTWVHVHCSNGRGRTSMIHVMFDIMKNAPMVAVEDILKRQQLLGSVDLKDTTVWKKGTYNTDQLEARKQFIYDFYTFIVQRKNAGVQLWSDWNKQKG